MNNLNSILIEGVLVADAVIRETPKGKMVGTFKIVSSRFYKDDDSALMEEASHFSVEFWGTLAKVSIGKAVQGRGCRIVGRLKEDRCNGTDGKPQSKVTIVAEHIEYRPEIEAPAPKKRTSTKKKV